MWQKREQFYVFWIPVQPTSVRGQEFFVRTWRLPNRALLLTYLPHVPYVLRGRQWFPPNNDDEHQTKIRIFLRVPGTIPYYGTVPMVEVQQMVCTILYGMVRWRKTIRTHDW